MRGYLTAPLLARVGVLFAAGGAQAFVGWWMVRSGLEEPPGAHDVPRVSPYRLATHLSVAFAIFTGLLWTTLQARRGKKKGGRGRGRAGDGCGRE